MKLQKSLSGVWSWGLESFRTQEWMAKDSKIFGRGAGPLFFSALTQEEQRELVSSEKC